MPSLPDRGPAFRPALEALEDRTMPASLFDVGVPYATTLDSHSVSFAYTLTQPAALFYVGVYRSADAQLSADDPLVGLSAVGWWMRDAAGQVATTAGLHAITLNGINLPQHPSLPHVIVVADPAAQLAEANEANNADSFRKHLVGVVTHGFSLEPGVPAWATEMAAALRARGYDAAFAFDWAALSKVPAPGLSTLAAFQLAFQANAVAASLPRAPGDVVDLHAVGHSRGTVVNSLAVSFLDGSPWYAGGWVRETMLDAHPARNLLPYNVAVADLVFGGNNISEGAFFAYRPGPVGVTAMLAVLASQQAMNDPVPFFARNVDQAEVFYQNTPGVQEPLNLANMDSYANSWGYPPWMIGNHSSAPVQSFALHGLFHFQVPLWYLGNLGVFVG